MKSEKRKKEFLPRTTQTTRTRASMSDYRFVLVRAGSWLIIFMLFAISNMHAQSGVIRELSGEVELKPAGTSAFVPARAGSTVAQDTIVSTGFRSTAVIVVGSNTITVRPLTRLSLSEIAGMEGTENLNVSLQTGRIRVDVKPPAGNRATTRVQSPSATASVRGTSFEMDTRNLTVTEGSVIFHGNNGFQVPVTAGDTSAVNIGQSAQDPIVLAAAELLPSAPVGASDAGEEITSGVTAPTEDVDVSLGW